MKLFKQYSHKTMLTSEFTKTLMYAMFYALPLYLGSSYLEQFLDDKWLGLVYGIAGTLGIITAFEASKYLNVLSNYRTTFLSGLLCITASIALSVLQDPVLAISAFIIHLIAINILWLNLNISLEEISKNTETGVVRGMFLTLTNLGVLLAPIIAGILYAEGGFKLVYFVSSFCIIPILYLTRKYTRTIKEPVYVDLSLTNSLRSIFRKPDVLHITFVQFILSAFYAVMIMYSGIYITSTTTISMAQFLGIIMPIALVPFVIFPYGLGKIADLIWGEKEILMIGMLILSIMCFVIPVVHTNNIVIWSLIMFLSRVGASFVESMTNVYFYKKIESNDVGIITLFNNVSSFALVITPILTAILLGVFSYPMWIVFVIMGAVCLMTLTIIAEIHDTL